MATRKTLQKEIVLSTLRTLRSHPTAAMLYEEIHRTHPTISRSTVYRVLGQMAEEGIILRLGIAGSDDRYDGDTSQHSHIRCRLCGRVDDLPAVTVSHLSEAAGYTIESCTVAYAGVCPRCQTTADAPLLLSHSNTAHHTAMLVNHI